MQATQKIFIGFVAFCATLGAAIGVFLYASLVPYFSLIGKFAAGLLITVLVCAAGLCAVWTYAEAGILLARRRRERRHDRLVVHGDVAAYLGEDGKWTHLSAQHEQAKLPPVTVPALPSPDIRWDAVLDLRKNKHGMHAIADMTQIPYNKVRAFLNQVEGNKSET